MSEKYVSGRWQCPICTDATPHHHSHHSLTQEIVELRSEVAASRQELEAFRKDAATHACCAEAKRYREALEKINLGRHGKLDATDMALVAWTALRNEALPQSPGEEGGS